MEVARDGRRISLKKLTQVRHLGWQKYIYIRNTFYAEKKVSPKYHQRLRTWLALRWQKYIYIKNTFYAEKKVSPKCHQRLRTWLALRWQKYIYSTNTFLWHFSRKSRQNFSEAAWNLRAIFCRGARKLVSFYAENCHPSAIRG
jgi:hypothetical protein